MKKQLIELLEMKDNRINGLEKRVFELKAERYKLLVTVSGYRLAKLTNSELLKERDELRAELAEANGLLGEVEELWFNSRNDYFTFGARLTAILAKRKGGADGEEEGT